jgi:beta-galactosidase beta subunit
MIIDRIENAHMYYGLGEKIKTSLEYLENYDLSKF